ncbi:MAG: hypothetical protein CL926_13615 [Deltaproteobacteria bacterium]|nr:hypothetical protein [Deltaproteobacteria bacterium]
MLKISFTPIEYLFADIRSLLPESYREIETEWGLATTEILEISNYDSPVVLISPANTKDGSDYPIGIFPLSNSVTEIDWIGFNNYSSNSETFGFDANNDGLLDILVPGSGGHNPTGIHGEIPFLGINRGTGFEDISDSVFTKTTGVPSPADWLFADFDGNGYQDIVLLNVTYDPTYMDLTTLYLNNGDESFTSRKDLLPSSIAGDDATSSEGPLLASNMYYAMEAGDMDNDGDLDIVVGESWATRWSAETRLFSEITIPTQIWENDGTGKFGIASSIFPFRSDTDDHMHFTNLKLKDVTDNGSLEVIFPVDDHQKKDLEDSYKGSDLTIYTRKEDGNYTNIALNVIDSASLEIKGYWPYDISIIDVNNDSYEDIIVELSPWGNLGLSPSAVIYYNNGSNFFVPEHVEISNQWAGTFELFHDGSDEVVDAYQFTRGNTFEGNGGYIKISGVLSEVRTDRVGTNGDDLLVGFGDGASITPLEGNDKVVGAAGLDIVIFKQSKDESIVQIGDNGSFKSVEFGSEINTLTSVERIEFSDKGLALDLNGNAGTTAKILGAFFGASGAERADLVKAGLNLLDGGTTYEGFLQAALDAVFGPNPSGAELVNHFYSTLTGQVAPQSLIEQYGSLIDNGSISPLALGMQVAEHELNIQNIDLIGLAATGIEYI